MLFITTKFNHKSLVSEPSKEWNITLLQIQVNKLLQWLILDWCVRHCKSRLWSMLKISTQFIKYNQIHFPLFSIQCISILQLFTYNMFTVDPLDVLSFWFKQKIKSKICHKCTANFKYWQVKKEEEKFPSLLQTVTVNLLKHRNTTHKVQVQHKINNHGNTGQMSRLALTHLLLLYWTESLKLRFSNWKML